MPFQSEKQRRYLHANHPEIAKRWEEKYATGGISNHFRKKFDKGSNYGQFERRQAHNVAAGKHAMNVGGGGGNGGNGPPSIVHAPKGPSAAEIAAAKAAAAAKAKAEAEAKHKNWLHQKAKEKKKKVSWVDKLNPFPKKLDEFGTEKIYTEAFEAPKAYTYAMWEDEPLPPQLQKPYDYGVGQGNISNIRHAVGTSIAKDAISDYLTQKVPTDKWYSGPIKKGADIAGGIGAWTHGLGQEIGDAYRSIKQGHGIKQSVEDVIANSIGLTLDKGTTWDKGDEVAEYYATSESPVNEYLQSLSEGQRGALTQEHLKKQLGYMAEGGIANHFKLKNGGSYAMQGGVKNYLGDQQTVSGVPVKWRSGPDKPETELAYITKAEKDLILKKDLHGSLKDGPNTGPEGLMSLDSQGDTGTYGQTGQSYGDRQTSDTSPEVGDKGGGYTEKGDPGHKEYELNREIREANQKAADEAKEATRVPTSKEIHDSILDKHAHRFKSLKDLTLDQKTRWAKDKYEDFKTAKGFLSIAAGPFGWLSAGKAVLDAEKRKKETLTELKKDIKTLTDLGYPTHHHTVDTLIQSLNQEILDMTQRKDQKDTGGDGVAPVPPVPLPVVMDEIAGATGQIDMFDAWGEIKRKQALRASLFADEDQAKVGEWVGDKRLLVNSGGLANLFRVKNQ